MSQHHSVANKSRKRTRYVLQSPVPSVPLVEPGYLTFLIWYPLSGPVLESSSAALPSPTVSDDPPYHLLILVLVSVYALGRGDFLPEILAFGLGDNGARGCGSVCAPSTSALISYPCKETISSDLNSEVDKERVLTHL